VINIKSGSVRNFMSYGNVPTEFDLQRDSTTLIIGPNGAGKSVVPDFLCYGFFGKPYRKIKLPQLINSINSKNSVVTLDFDVGAVSYKIVRGQKPKIFQIFKDGVLVEEEAATRDYQGYLETQILKMSYKTFCQIVVMGSSAFTPFMALETASRRGIIEDVLDISLFTSMNELLKERVKATKIETALVDVKIESAKKETVSQKRVIELMKSAVDSRVAEEEAAIADVKILIESESSKINKLTEAFKKFPGVPEFDEKVLSKLKSESYSLENDISRITSRIDSFDDLDVCPTCVQHVGHDHKGMVKDEWMNDQTDMQRKLDAVNLKIEFFNGEREKFIKMQTMQSKYETEIARMETVVRGYGTTILNHEKNIERVRANVGDIEEEKRKLVEVAKSAMELIQRRNVLIEEKSMQDVAVVLLRDSGIKAAIIKEYVPILNSLINRYLGLFGFDVNFRLDENFDETVHSRGRDEFSYNSFSEGEKRKIDIAILMAFRKITELKNSSTCNLLVMDEIVYSSLDPASREVFMDIILSEGGNYFVISHTSPTMDVFDAVMEVSKVGDFSVYEYLK
jgi:DNA repair exonuclease SbcCD ATPase subunit